MVKEIRKITDCSCLSTDPHKCEYDNCRKHEDVLLQKLVDEHDKKVRNDAIEDVERELLANGFIFTEHALEVWHNIAEQLRERSK